jgi:hypothetical protein
MQIHSESQSVPQRELGDFAGQVVVAVAVRAPVVHVPVMLHLMRVGHRVRLCMCMCMCACECVCVCVYM